MLFYDYCRGCFYGECCEPLELFKLIDQRQKGTIPQSHEALLLRCVFCNTWEAKKKWKNKIIITSGDEAILEDYFDDLIEGVWMGLQKLNLCKVKAPTNKDVLRKLNVDLEFSLRGDAIEFVPSQIVSPEIFLGLLDQLNLSEKYLSPEEIEISNNKPKDYNRIRRIIVKLLNERVLRDVTFLSKISSNSWVERLIHETDDAFFSKSIKQVMKIIQSGKEYFELDQEMKTKIKVFNQHLILSIFHGAILKTRSPTLEPSAPPLLDDLVFAEEIKDCLKCLIIEYRIQGHTIFDFVNECIADLKPVSERARQQKSRFHKWITDVMENRRSAFVLCRADAYEDELTHYGGDRLVNGIETALRDKIIEFTFEEIQKLRKLRRK